MHLTKNSALLYFNQGDIAPYALGVISVEVPYDAGLFYTDMRHNCLDEYVCEYEYDNGYEWKVIEYSEDKLSVVEENTEYPPEEIYSEYYPVGMMKITVKGIGKKGNAKLTVAHVKKGEGIESATKIIYASIYVDENNKITLVGEDEEIH